MAYLREIPAETIDTPDIRKFLKQSLLLIRPFHIINQWTVLLLVLSLKDIIFTTSLTDIFTVWITSFLIMPLLFIINDYLHQKEDRIMHRERLFTTFNFSKYLVLGVCASLVIILMAASLNHSVINFVSLIFTIVVATLYGLFKHRKQMKRTYLFRALSGSSLYIFYASYFGFSAIDILGAIFIGFWDLQAHFAGDLRDYPKDLLARLNTLPIKNGISNTLSLIFKFQFIGIVLILAIYALLDVSQIYRMLIIIFFINYFGWTAYFTLVNHLKVPYEWLHACFHGPKILSTILIALDLMHIATIPLIFTLILAAGVWFLMYASYLWSDNRILIASEDV